MDVGSFLSSISCLHHVPPLPSPLCFFSVLLSCHSLATNKEIFGSTQSEVLNKGVYQFEFASPQRECNPINLSRSLDSRREERPLNQGNSDHDPPTVAEQAPCSAAYVLGTCALLGKVADRSRCVLHPPSMLSLLTL